MLASAACTGEIADFAGGAAADPRDAGTLSPPDGATPRPGDAGPRPDPPPPPPLVDAGPMPTTETGGSITPAGCGYAVRTRAGATAPWVAPANRVGNDPAPKQIHLGLSGDAARGMVILWRTRDNTTLASSVRWGEDSVDEHRLEGFTFTFRSGTSSSSTRLRMHEGHLCGLKPDTIYKYQVGSDASWSPEYTFRTAPDLAADPSAQVTVLVMGDSRGGQTYMGGLLEDAEGASDPDLILFTGDAVTSGVGQSEWDQFFERGMPLLPYVPIVMANGNHEWNALNWFAQIAQPGDEDVFGLDYGPLHVTVLNDSPTSDATITGSQKTFLQRDLADHASAPWRFVMHHRSQWSASGGHGSSTELQNAWGPTIDAGRVRLVLSGHDHNYERTRPLRNKLETTQANGTTYIVAGGAGAELYASGRKWFTAFSEKRRHFVVLSIRRGAIDGRAYREDGSVMDSFTLLP